jgi:hypothetical protein
MNHQYKNVFILLFLICFMFFIISNYVSADESSSADTSLDEKTCGKKKNLIDQLLCYAALATKLDDVSICDAASHEGVRYQCYAIYAERRSKPDVCEAIPSKSAELKGLRDVCISDVAKKAGDFTLCAKIETQGLRDSCYLGVAKKTGDTSICEKIQDKGLKSGCTGKPVYVQ